MAGAADQSEFAVLEKLLQQLPQAELHWLAVHQGQQNRAEIALQGGAALQFRQHRLGDCVAAQLHHDTHAIPIALVADVGDAADPALIHLLRQLFDPASLAELVGKLGDHDGAASMAPLAGLHLLDVGDPPHGDAAAAQEIGVAQASADEYLAAGGEVWSRDHLEKLLVAEFRSADQGDQGIDDFTEVVGGDAGGHAHGDAGAPIEQQKGKLGWQHRRLLLGAIEVGREIDGVAADLLKQRFVGDRRQPGLGVAHRRRRIVVHRAEVAMPVQQGMAAGEGLHQAHQRVVHRLIAVGVIFAEHVAHHAGAFAVGTVGGEAQLVHREQDAALHRFESVPHVGEGAPHDHTHRVLEVRALHLLMQGDRFDPVVPVVVAVWGPAAVLGHPVSESGGRRRRSAYRWRPIAPRFKARRLVRCPPWRSPSPDRQPVSAPVGSAVGVWRRAAFPPRADLSGRRP